RPGQPSPTTDGVTFGIPTRPRRGRRSRRGFPPSRNGPVGPFVPAARGLPGRAGGGERQLSGERGTGDRPPPPRTEGWRARKAGDDGDAAAPAVVSPTAPTGEAVEPSAAGGSPPQVTAAERGGQPPLLPCLDIRRRVGPGPSCSRAALAAGEDAVRLLYQATRRLRDCGIYITRHPAPPAGGEGVPDGGGGGAGPAVGLRPGLDKRRKGVARKYFKDELPPGCDGSLSGRGGRGRTNEPGGMATMAPGHPEDWPPQRREESHPPHFPSTNQARRRCKWTLI
ncbi:hypothetical protein THAOC_07039, partial [Thalassiosira oceanica]